MSNQADLLHFILIAKIRAKACAVLLVAVSAVALVLLGLRHGAIQRKGPSPRRIDGVAFLLPPPTTRSGQQFDRGGSTSTATATRADQQFYQGERIVATAVSASLVNFTLNWIHYLNQLKDEVSVQIVGLSPGVCNSFSDKPMVKCHYSNSLAEDKTNITVFRSEQYQGHVARKLTAFSNVIDRSSDGSIILLSDVDVVFVSDPFEFQLPKNTDVAFSQNQFHCGQPRTRDGPHQVTHLDINSGIIFVRVSPQTKQLFHSAIEELEKGNTYDGTDQGALTSALRVTNTTFAYLPITKFANGFQFFVKHCHENIVAVHTTFMTNSRVKKHCLSSSGLWFGDSAYRFPDVRVSGHVITGCSFRNSSEAQRRIRG